MADAALISMPFATITAPSIGLSLLKAETAQRGISASIHYFSIRFAELLGWFPYRDIAHDNNPPIEDLAGEWIFNRALFDTTPEQDKRYVNEILLRRADPFDSGVERRVVERVLRARTRVDRFLDWCLERVLRDNPRIVGFTSSFQQHVASLALARRIKLCRPDTAIVFGGANCVGIIGAETIRQFPFIDAVVSGEGDLIVPEMFERLLERRPVDGLPGVRTHKELERQPPSWSSTSPVQDLDSLPFPDYSDFFSQFRSSRFGPTLQPSVFFESSRGCWWGQKSPCTFCALNGPTATYRSKSPGRALDEILHIAKTYRGCDIYAIDNILDMKYFDEFIPELAKARLRVDLFYDVKANLHKQQVRMLRDAGITIIRPGIESFSDSVLKLMRKGVTGLQNIQILKWCKEFGIHPLWNLLWGFPGEDAAEYRVMAKLVPLLSHLQPPQSFGEFRLDRFSPNFEQASQFGFTDVRPLAAYPHIYPFAEDVLRNLAYSFSFSYYDRRSPASYVGRLRQRLESWESLRCGADLFSIDLGEAIAICDLRPRAKRFLTVLSGIDRKIYLAADSVTDARTLSQLHGQPPDRIAHRMNRMVRLGLMLRDGHRCLALAIPIGDYQPGPRARARFRQAMRRVGTRVPGGTRIQLAQTIAVRKQQPAQRRRALPKKIDASLFVVQDERTILVRDCR